MDRVDVLVIGGGNAALCAALAAREAGASVRVIERAPEDRRGGNSAFTGGAFRVAFRGIEDLRQLMPDLTPDEVDNTDFGTYTADTFYDELARQSQFRADADLLDLVAEASLPTLVWMRQHGVRFVPSFGRQSFVIDGKRRFWGGLVVEASGGGLGLVASLYRSAQNNGVDVRYDERVNVLTRSPDASWVAQSVTRTGDTYTYHAGVVILATGGFHANLEWRARYLGPGWDLAKVRGSRYNVGDGIRMALDVGAIPHGHWSGCHAVFFDANAAPFGDINVLDQQKNYFPLGIVVNTAGKRFVDEGADFRNYTYSSMGDQVLRQPSGIAWQVFDQQTVALLPAEYRVRHASRMEAGTLEELAQRMEGIDADAFLATVREYNAAVDTSRPFIPAIKDGRATHGLAIAKSNWATRLDSPPFVAFAVTCGITCTYGGVKVDPHARVLDAEDAPILGLYAAGEMVGGLYYVRYAGGAGLTSGAVLGKTAGTHAATTLTSRRHAPNDSTFAQGVTR